MSDLILYPYKSEKKQDTFQSVFPSNALAAKALYLHKSPSTFVLSLLEKYELCAKKGWKFSLEQTYWLQKLATEFYLKELASEGEKQQYAKLAGSNAPKPAFQQHVSLYNVYQYMKEAKSKSLVSLTFSYTAQGMPLGQDVRLHVTGKTAKVPGSVAVTNGMPYGSPDGKYYGLIEDGMFKPTMLAPKHLIDELLEMNDDFVGYVANHGKFHGRCVFCQSDLTDDKSKEAGYGPVCAKKWGLPWGGKDPSPKGAPSPMQTVMHAIEKLSEQTTDKMLADLAAHQKDLNKEKNLISKLDADLMSVPDGGTYQLTGGSITTGPIPYNATAEEVNEICKKAGIVDPVFVADHKVVSPYSWCNTVEDVEAELTKNTLGQGWKDLGVFVVYDEKKLKYSYELPNGCCTKQFGFMATNGEIQAELALLCASSKPAEPAPQMPVLKLKPEVLKADFDGKLVEIERREEEAVDLFGHV